MDLEVTTARATRRWRCWRWFFSPKKWSTLEKSWTAKFGLCWLSPLNFVFQKGFHQWTMMVFLFLPNCSIHGWVWVLASKEYVVFTVGDTWKRKEDPVISMMAIAANFDAWNHPTKKMMSERDHFICSRQKSPFVGPSLLMGVGWFSHGKVHLDVFLGAEVWFSLGFPESSITPAAETQTKEQTQGTNL